MCSGLFFTLVFSSFSFSLFLCPSSSSLSLPTLYFPSMQLVYPNHRTITIHYHQNYNTTTTTTFPAHNLLSHPPHHYYNHHHYQLQHKPKLLVYTTLQHHLNYPMLQPKPLHHCTTSFVPSHTTTETITLPLPFHPTTHTTATTAQTNHNQSMLLLDHHITITAPYYNLNNDSGTTSILLHTTISFKPFHATTWTFTPPLLLPKLYHCYNQATLLPKP